MRVRFARLITHCTIRVNVTMQLRLVRCGSLTSAGGTRTNTDGVWLKSNAWKTWWGKLMTMAGQCFLNTKTMQTRSINTAAPPKNHVDEPLTQHIPVLSSGGVHPKKHVASTITGYDLSADRRSHEGVVSCMHNLYTPTGLVAGAGKQFGITRVTYSYGD